MLQFSALIAHANVSITACYYPKSLSGLINQVIEYLAVQDEEFPIDVTRPKLLQSLLIAITVFDNSSDYDLKTASCFKSWQEENIWTLVLGFVDMDIPTTCEPFRILYEAT